MDLTVVQSCTTPPIDFATEFPSFLYLLPTYIGSAAAAGDLCKPRLCTQSATPYALRDMT